MAVSPLLHHSHEVLNEDHCSGYVDAFGKWNTGFPCPWTDSTIPGYCCGTDTYKYCCSGKLKLVVTSPPPINEDPLLLVLAVTLGVAAGVTLMILIACFVCPGCLLHKKRRPGPLYRLPCSSTMTTYVSTVGPGHNHQQHRPNGANDVLRTSASFHSFLGSTSASGNNINEGRGGGVSSIYSLSEPLCSNVQTDGTADQQDEPPSCQQQHQHPHHHHRSLYWSNRAVPLQSSHQHHEPQYGGMPQLRSNQGPVLQLQREVSPAPPYELPPPYEANFRPIRHHPNQEAHHPLRVGQLLAGRHQHISPRQPALCIIEDGQRQDDSQLTYHSTKF